ncbi:acyltransferase family protein [Leptospira venezuelensis]|uniref:acyltransferase family protein n=1 Tax=Leptospira venezuelensis TaxID=1958811 RepID=UPI000A3851CE|nr:acyltransferase family protein [Leptospira venezuelensis]
MSHNNSLNYRPDIDGLRAIAVLSVLIYHAFPQWLPGGFIGVDIFFVISGYLISSILFKKMDTNELSFSEFYKRRIHRIFPALLLVIFISLVFGFFALYPEEYSKLGKHSVAGILFFSNFTFLNEVSDYFNPVSEQKPFLHLWSLAIEEQFYIVWPFLLVAARRYRRLPTEYFLIALILLSFIFNVIDTKYNQINAFYLPVFRFWELLSGSLLSWIRIYRPSLFRFSSDKETDEVSPSFFNISNLISLVGFSLIVIGLALIDRSTKFPGFAAAIPVLGAVFLIYAGANSWWNRKILGSRLLVFVGLISFPLYLWHWPLLSFSNIIESGSPRWEIRTGAVILSFLFATLTWAYLEKKLRFNFQKKVTQGILIAALFIAIIGEIVFLSGGKNHNDAKPSALLEYQIATMFEQTKCSESFFQKIGGKIEFCNYLQVGAEPEVALIGDSHANHLYYGLFQAYVKKMNRNVINLSNPACAGLYGVIRTPGTERCSMFDGIFEYVIGNPKIKTVILSDRGSMYIGESSPDRKEIPWDYKIRNQSRPDLNSNQSAYEYSLISTVRKLLEHEKEVILAVDIPELDFDPEACGAQRPIHFYNSQLKDPCAISKAQFETHRNAYREIIEKVAKEFSGKKLKVWEPWKSLCDNNYCWAAKEGKILYSDKHHLNYIGSELVTQSLMSGIILPPEKL